MSQNHDNEEILEQDLETQAEQEAELYEEQEEIIEEQASEIERDESQIGKLKDALARSQADFVNFQKRTERDKSDMVFFLKLDIFKKILPRLDDLERIIENTPEGMKDGALFEGVIALQKTLLKDLESLGVTSFVSVGELVDPEKHEVMTQVPGTEGEIINEFEKGYMLGERVLRVAKVVVGNGQ
ncbi:nucleotide exchange factor GrpE [Candidatus Gracilibacteria bacterium]|nr:nucleotide exchange factor GrpE [Candidatus Gracilibacteria bacterium]